MTAAFDSSFFDDSYYAQHYRRRRWRARGDKPVLYRTLLRKLRPYAGGRLLDVGCGEGHLLRRATVLFDAHGIDISRAAVHAARRHTGLTTVSVGSATDLPYDDGYFDVVCALDIAEHLPDPGRLLAESSRVLRPGKLLVLSTPNPESLGHRLKGRGWHANGDESHIGIRPMNAWRALLAKYAFEIVRDGSDTMWDTPYVRWAPDRFQWAVFIGLAQAMWSIDVAFRWRLGENYVCFARKAAA